MAICPTRADLQACMPIFWPAKLQALLPLSAASILAKQQAVFRKDWEAVSEAWGDVSRDEYLYMWLLVNSRSFYHTTPQTLKLPKSDHMIMQPVADLFNHTAEADCCRVAYDEHFFSMTTGRSHQPGEELFISYGAHSNDFLLVEYGFSLAHGLNRWDEISLDPYLCPLLSKHQQALLEDAGFWGSYVLDAETACYRTQTALRLLYLGEAQWRAVLDGRRDEDADQEAVDEALLKILRVCEKDVRSTLARLDRLRVGAEESRESLRQRWLQIKELVIANIFRLKG